MGRSAPAVEPEFFAFSKPQTSMSRTGVILYWTWLAAGSILAGCGTTHDDLPTQDQVQQQLERDAAVRAEEDRLEAAGRN